MTFVVLSGCGTRSLEWAQTYYTCLYAGMGAQLFLDILRSVTPTHIVRSYVNSFVEGVDALPPLSADFLTSAPGLFRMPEKYIPPHPSFTAESDTERKVCSQRNGSILNSSQSCSLSLQGSSGLGDLSASAAGDHDDAEMYASSDEALGMTDPSRYTHPHSLLLDQYRGSPLATRLSSRQ